MAKIPTKIAAKAATAPTKTPAKRLSKPPAPPVKPEGKPLAPKKKPAVEAVIEPPAPAPIAKKAAARKKPAALPAGPDAVAVRAYYLGENRRAQGLPGDEHHDWLEAERQLQTESAPQRRTRKN